MDDEEILEYFKVRWNKKFPKISMTLSDAEVLEIAHASLCITQAVEKIKAKILKGE